MIKAQHLTKSFGDFCALNDISCSIDAGSIYGLVGSNGAGKSTLIRILAGVYRQDRGAAVLGDRPIYNNPEVLSRIAYVPDELYFLPGASMDRTADMYKSCYARFDRERYRKLSDRLSLNRKATISTFSKGMKRQAATVLALSTLPDFILFDETFDGLDPVMRNYVKSVICEDVVDRGAAALFSSHSLRELEDSCDQLALLHRGGLVLESDIQNLKTAQFKVQIAFAEDFDKSLFENIPRMCVLRFVKHGSVANMIVRGDRDDVSSSLRALSPLLLDILPLTLEEVFTYELEALGYNLDPELGGLS